ncbi:MAG: pilR [Clostridiales bacterium]|jgi:DNA-binding NtrC family response regulator|nr:pilR [Clostridiales bacterium]
MTKKILIVDDEDDFRKLLVKRLNRKNYSASGAATGQAALEILADEVFDVALIDLKMPGMDGLELLQRIKKSQPEMEVMVLTGHGTTESAVEAMKRGAYDYLTKPVDLQELQLLIEKAREKVILKRRNRGLSAALERENIKRYQGMLGVSEAMENLRQLVGKVADSTSPVLVEGESGVGKELVSRALHFESLRADAPFIVVNCGALPEQLLESELFGHEKGAFTGAQTAKSGLVEMADGGSLFLDEVGELALGLQVKLLRFLENGEFRRVGDNRLRGVKVRVIAATNRKLAEEVEKGNFREDLFYRLNVLRIKVPPLRERKEDIPLLADFFLKKNAPQKKLTKEAIEALQNHDFPGNVRELANLIERGALLAEGDLIAPEDLFGSLEKKPQSRPLTLAELEKEHIKKTLDSCNWNKTKTAELLDISVRNLYRKIETYGLKPDQ